MVDQVNFALHNCFGHMLVSTSFRLDSGMQAVHSAGNYQSTYMRVGPDVTTVYVSLKLSTQEVQALNGTDTLFSVLQNNIAPISSMTTNTDFVNGLYIYDLKFMVTDLELFVEKLDKLNLAQSIYDETFHKVLEQTLQS
jgi:hypothetical protein